VRKEPNQDERNQSRYSYSSGSLTVYATISSDGIDERLIGLMTYPLRADIRWFNVQASPRCNDSKPSDHSPTYAPSSSRFDAESRITLRCVRAWGRYFAITDAQRRGIERKYILVPLPAWLDVRPGYYLECRQHPPNVTQNSNIELVEEAKVACC